MKDNARRNTKSEEEKRGGEEGCTLSFYIRYFEEFLAVETNYLTEEVYLVVTCSKIRLEVFIGVEGGESKLCSLRLYWRNISQFS